MKKQINALKLTFLGAAVAAFGVGCASSGSRQHAKAELNTGMGDSAQVEMGVATDSSDAAAAESTVSALGRTVDTRASAVNKFPFYDYNLRTIETYTFAVPDPTIHVAATDPSLPLFSEALPPGSVFVEAAGGSGEVRAGRVIRHSSNPSR